VGGKWRDHDETLTRRGWQVSYETCLEAGHMTKLKIKKGTSVMRGKQLVKVLPPCVPPSFSHCLNPLRCVVRVRLCGARDYTISVARGWNANKWAGLTSARLCRRWSGATTRTGNPSS